MKKVLLVTRVPAGGHYLGSLFSSPEFDCDYVCDTTELSRFLLERQPDCVLIQVDFPGGGQDGVLSYEAVAALEVVKPLSMVGAVKVVMFTANRRFQGQVVTTAMETYNLDFIAAFAEKLPEALVNYVRNHL